jgi:hypothetical protein
MHQSFQIAQTNFVRQAHVRIGVSRFIRGVGSLIDGLVPAGAAAQEQPLVPFAEIPRFPTVRSVHQLSGRLSDYLSDPSLPQPLRSYLSDALRNSAALLRDERMACAVQKSLTEALDCAGFWDMIKTFCLEDTKLKRVISTLRQKSIQLSRLELEILEIEENFNNFCRGMQFQEFTLVERSETLQSMTRALLRIGETLRLTCLELDSFKRSAPQDLLESQEKERLGKRDMQRCAAGVVCSGVGYVVITQMEESWWIRVSCALVGSGFLLSFGLSAWYSAIAFANSEEFKMVIGEIHSERERCNGFFERVTDLRARMEVQLAEL